MSYNEINQSHLSASGAGFAPPASFRNLILNGNPGLRPSPLPSWITRDSTSVREGTQAYSCAPIRATSAPLLEMTVDPEFTNYEYCMCIPGNFGRAPLCSPIPNYAEMNPTRMIRSAEIGDDFATLIQQTGGLASTLAYARTNSSDSSTALRYSQAFSDTMYGDSGRLMKGLSTAWVIDLTNVYADDVDGYLALGRTPPSPIVEYSLDRERASSTPLLTPVRVITLHLHVSSVTFSAFEDVITVYEGDTDLKGARVYHIRGTDPKPNATESSFTSTPEYQALHNASIHQLDTPRLIEVPIFATKATIQFDNRNSEGRYFYATYSYDFRCPSGYFYDTTAATPFCRVNYPIYSVMDGIRSAVYSVSGVSMAWVIFNIIVLAMNWNHLIYKAGSRNFLLLVLVLLGGLALGSLLYAAVPTNPADDTSKAICIGRAWLTCLPLSGVLAVLLAKTSRLNSIFNAKTLQVQKRTDFDILISVIIVCLLQIVLLGVFSGLPLSRPQLTLGAGGLSDKLVLGCSQERGFMTWFGVQVAFVCSLIFPSVYFGFKTRDLPSQYNESSHIQNAVVLLMFFGVIIIPLDIFVQDDPTAAILIQGLGQALLCLLLTTILFGPKLYYLTQFGARSLGVDHRKHTPTPSFVTQTVPSMSRKPPLSPVAVIGHPHQQGYPNHGSLRRASLDPSSSGVYPRTLSPVAHPTMARRTIMATAAPPPSPRHVYGAIERAPLPKFKPMQPIAARQQSTSTSTSTSASTSASATPSNTPTVSVAPPVINLQHLQQPDDQPSSVVDHHRVHIHIDTGISPMICSSPTDAFSANAANLNSTSIRFDSTPSSSPPSSTPILSHPLHPLIHLPPTPSVQFHPHSHLNPATDPSATPNRRRLMIHTGSVSSELLKMIFNHEQNQPNEETNGTG